MCAPAHTESRCGLPHGKSRRQCVRGGRSFPGISFAQIVGIANYSKISIQKKHSGETSSCCAFSFYIAIVKIYLRGAIFYVPGGAQLNAFTSVGAYHGAVF